MTRPTKEIMRSMMKLVSEKISKVSRGEMWKKSKMLKMHGKFSKGS